MSSVLSKRLHNAFHKVVRCFFLFIFYRYKVQPFLAMSDENLLVQPRWCLSNTSFQEKKIYICSPVLHASYSFPENGKLYN